MRAALAVTLPFSQNESEVQVMNIVVPPILWDQHLAQVVPASIRRQAHAQNIPDSILTLSPAKSSFYFHASLSQHLSRPLCFELNSYPLTDKMHRLYTVLSYSTV